MDERSMSDDDYEATLYAFVADLRYALQAAGTPSYAQLEQASARLRARPPGPVKLDVLARSTTHDILSGRRTQPPRWRWVVSYITVLHAMARDGGVAVDRIGTIDAWKDRHERVCSAAELATRRPAGVGGRHRKPAEDERASSLRPAPDMIPPQRAV
jgi:hypothetical protein